MYATYAYYCAVLALHFTIYYFIYYDIVLISLVCALQTAGDLPMTPGRIPTQPSGSEDYQPDPDEYDNEDDDEDEVCM